MFITKNANKILNQPGIRAVGSMRKSDWERDEAQYAENIKKRGMRTVTKKQWDRTHNDYKGMIKGQPYMMWFDKKTQSTVYGPVQIKESVNEFDLNEKKYKTTATKSELKTAYELGVKAFNRGIKRAPMLDKNLVRMLKGKEVADTSSIDIMDAWLKAWDTTNLKVPVGESVNEGKDDFVARHGKANIILKKGYKHHKDTDLEKLYDKLGSLVKGLKVKDVTLVFESVNEGISVFDERHFGKNGIIIMIDDNGKKVSAIFKNKKNANKYNRNKESDLKALLSLAKKTPYPKAIDESINEKIEDFETGDLVHIPSINKSAMVLTQYGRKVHVQFPDGKEKTFNSRDLEKIYNESVNEGRAFVAAAKKAKEEGKTEFEFNGKTYPVTIKEVLRKINRKLR